jgi:hypothetical protein
MEIMLGERSALAAILSTSRRMLSREFKMQQGVRCAWAWNSYNRFRIVFRLPYRCKQERSVGKFIFQPFVLRDSRCALWWRWWRSKTEDGNLQMCYAAKLIIYFGRADLLRPCNHQFTTSGVELLNDQRVPAFQGGLLWDFRNLCVRSSGGCSSPLFCGELAIEERAAFA